MKKLLLIISIIIIVISVNAQYSQYKFGDTTERVYKYKLPILGAKAYESGFDIPLPAGIMLNYFMASQGIEIPDIAIGFSDGLLPEIPLTDITRLVEFEEVKAEAYSINVRPDVWVFPFLNVYGIFGKSYANTKVKLSYPISFETVANLEGVTYGIGTTGAFGVGPMFVVLDGNWVWTKMDNFVEPVQTKNFSMRLGKTFEFKKKPQSNVAIWAGAMRIRMGGVTEGHIRLNEVLPSEAGEKRDEIVEGYEEWYSEQDPLKQAVADRILTPIVDNIANADGAGTVHYKITKRPIREWNMIVGGQYQINPSWQLRTEAGIIGDRKSFLFSANYRFGI